jgi:hypothetical protein
MFRSDFRCPQCGVALGASALYARLLVLFSLLASVALVWGGVRGLQSCLLIPAGFLALSLPIGLLVLTVLVRVAPFMVRPTLVMRQRYVLTGLNLTSRGKDDPGT